MAYFEELAFLSYEKLVTIFSIIYLQWMIENEKKSTKDPSIKFKDMLEDAVTNLFASDITLTKPNIFYKKMGSCFSKKNGDQEMLYPASIFPHLGKIQEVFKARGLSGEDHFLKRKRVLSDLIRVSPKDCNIMLSLDKDVLSTLNHFLGTDIDESVYCDLMRNMRRACYLIGAFAGYKVRRKMKQRALVDLMCECEEKLVNVPDVASLSADVEKKLTCRDEFEESI